MKFETVLHATIETVGEAGVIFNPRFVRFYEWLLRRDEQQRTEIARLQAELDADDLMAREAELFEYIRQLETDNVRLHARIATLERIIEREAEKMMKAGMPKEGINGKDN